MLNTFSSRWFDSHIGKILKQQDILTESQLNRALAVQKEKLRETGRTIYLGLIIVELGYASEDEVIQAINEHYRLSVSSLNENIEELIREKSGSIIRRFSVMHVPIWLQISLTTTFIIIVTIFSLSLVILTQQKQELYKQTLKIGSVSLTYFTNNARIPLLEDNILRLNTLIKEASAVEGLNYAIIVDKKGTIKAHTDVHQIGNPFVMFPHDTEKRLGENVIYFPYISDSEEQILNLSRKIVFQDKELGEAHVGVSVDFIEDLIHKKKMSITWVSIAVIVVGIAVAITLGFHFSRPVSQLVKATEEIARGNYQHKIENIGNDELGNLAIAFNRMSKELWMKSMMERSFGKYVGSEVLSMIRANPETVWLKGKRCQATVLFADIRGFTAYSEVKEPEEIVENINQFFEIVTDIIRQYGGYVDKFIGDAVLAVFGVPVFSENHIEQAVKAAVKLQYTLKMGGKNENPLLTSVGISINSGVAVSGNIGSQMKMEYTVIGDSVNVASRMNSFAGPGQIIISKPIYENLKNVLEVEKLPPTMIKGKSAIVELFRILEYKETRYV